MSHPNPSPVRPQRVGRPEDKKSTSFADTLLIQSHGSVHRVDRSAPHSSRQGKDTGPAAVDVAVRLISETAHDLRSPLATVVATMEMIRDGELGSVTSMQSDCLQAALRQCEYLGTLVGEMLYADGLLGGQTSVHRRATRRIEVRQMVRDSTAAVLLDKRIDLLFDGFDRDESPLYVDANILCRLLVNLVVNAGRASREGATILIKTHDDNECGLARWSVVDCGDGIDAARLHGLNQSNTQAQRNVHQTRAKATDREISAGGPGLGLMICRQLAMLNYSRLKIRSRLGSGTDVSFTTPLAHPTAIATAFSKFRSDLFHAPVRPKLENVAPIGERNERSDASTSWNEVTLDLAGPGPRHPDRVAIGAITVSGEVSASVLERLDQSLQSQLGRFEMSYRTTRRTWAWVLDADHRSIAWRLRQLHDALDKFGDTELAGEKSSCQIAWGTPHILPVEHRSLRSRLIDRMTTLTLSASQQATVGGARDHDTVRLGTHPIEPSPIAATRLDEELRRLSVHLKRQSEKMKTQSAGLHPLPPTL